MTTRTAIVSLLAFALACVPTMAQSEGSPGTPAGDTGGDRLAAGSKAPALSIDEVIKGKPVDGLKEGTAYVVEFWATWCPPCVASIPHLTKLQKKHKNIVVLGVAGSERGGKDPLEAFVKKQGSKMAYTVAYDGDRSMSAAWLSAAGQNGIPCAFVVDTKGTISWIGNPHDKSFDAEVAKVAKGSKLPKADKGGSKEGDKSDDAKSDDQPKSDDDKSDDKSDDQPKGASGSDGATNSD
ncbi:MAG: TlpA family protein disulfide reductase [Phycisphaerae bacterium]|nr:TlpA family protein disulfide reductase [Phycisphaerae bacterium]